MLLGTGTSTVGDAMMKIPRANRLGRGKRGERYWEDTAVNGRGKGGENIGKGAALKSFLLIADIAEPQQPRFTRTFFTKHWQFMTKIAGK